MKGVIATTTPTHKALSVLRKNLAILDDTIKRSVGLIAWMEVNEVLPYYIEGLIHLTGLFESRVIKFDGEKLLYDYSNYDELKKWYKKTYLDLAEVYTKKADAKEFLDKKRKIYFKIRSFNKANKSYFHC